MNSTRHFVAGSAVFAAVLSATAGAQTPTVVLREGDTISSGTVSSLSNPDVNTIGGFGITLTAGTVSAIWGDFSGPPGVGSSVLREEQLGLSGYDQTGFETFWGLSDTNISYGPTCTDLNPPNTAGLDCVWIDATPVGVELQPFPPEMAMGHVYRFNSRPNVIKTTGEPVWIAGIDDAASNDVGNRMLRGTTPTVVFSAGVPAPAPIPASTVSASLDFDFRFSAAGTHNIHVIDTNLATTMDAYLIIDGVPAMTSSSTLIGEGTLVPAASGGNGTESWQNFDSLGINENGDFMFTGDTNAATLDEVIVYNGDIILREGDTVMDLSANTYTLAGDIDYAYMNESGDIACAWDVDVSGNEALLLNGVVLLKEGDEVDWDGDGVIDPGHVIDTTNAFTGISAIAVGPRIGGTVRVYVVADVDLPGGSTLEGFLCIEVPVGDAFPSFCNGDGGDQLGCTDCPCGNNALPGTVGGCLNSNATSARLIASGVPNVSMPADTLHFDMTGGNVATFGILTSGDNRLPNNPANICFTQNPGSGVQALGVLDGLRCVGGGLLRHGSRATDANGDIGITNNGWGPPNNPLAGIGVTSGFTAGQTRHFQVFYREDAMAGCLSGQNTSQGVSVTFL